MTTSNRCLIFALVATLGTLPPATADAADAAKGKATYEARCAFCHGMAGKGDGIAGSTLQPAPSNFTSPDYWKNTNPAQVRKTIEEGKPGTAMVAFKAILKPQDLDDLIAHLDTFKPK